MSGWALTPRATFPKRCRLRLRRDFARVFERKCSVADRRLVVYVERNELSVTRIGLSVGRKHGGAVRRNRIKRLLRESFRLCRAELAIGLDLICIPRAGRAATRDEYEASLLKLARTGAEKLAGRFRPGDRESRVMRNHDRPAG